MEFIMSNQSRFEDLLSLDFQQAKLFFLQASSYTNIDLPPYYNFQRLINAINTFLEENDNFSSFVNKHNLKNTEKVNYKLYANKDGNLSWRKLEFINPVLYVYLVNIITQKSNWSKIRKLFKQFQKNKKISCVSIPVKSLTKKSDKAEQISHWWKGIEQKSIELALDFDYLFETDIADCYGSIYTHSISWAIESKAVAKSKPHDKSLLGNQVDSVIQSMQYGQTNGIPQGSVLMDFIAEIVLGYVDEQLKISIKSEKISNYQIIRYRDDYRIFVNNPNDGTKILKLLSENLIEMGMRLNNAKTKDSSDVITSSIKADKIERYLLPATKNPAQQYLITIRELAKRYPNSGSLKRQLSSFYKYADRKRNYIKESDIPVLSSIITDILLNNPAIYPIGFAILSLILSRTGDVKLKKRIINSIHNKFKKKPNTGYMQIWFKRMIMDGFNEINFSEKLCNENLQNSDLWDVTWISSRNLRDILNNNSIFDKASYSLMDFIIRQKEFDIFSYDDDQSEKI